jgi:hypothetical protein
MPQLYLDTARMGQMTPGAQAAHCDFARLVGSMGASVPVERLLRRGYAACRPILNGQYPGLATWHGISEFKRSLRMQAGMQRDLPVLVSSRSAVLMQFAARQLLRRCKMVLTTDLTWPTYREIFWNECRKQGADSICLELADEVLHRQQSEEVIAEKLIDCFDRYGCDGLFLTSVSSLGGRLPIERVVDSVRERCRFVVVDGAQDYCHVGAEVLEGIADLYLAGCHKWLGAYYPLGLALFGREETRGELESAVRSELLEGADPLATDPLLQFVEDFQRGIRRPTGETVNLSNLFGVAGALSDARHGGPIEVRLRERQRNADGLIPVVESVGWEARLPRESLRSGVMLLKPGSRRYRPGLRGEVLRRRASGMGLALSAYDGGLVRLSMPDRPLSGCHHDHIHQVFRRLI